MADIQVGNDYREVYQKVARAGNEHGPPSGLEVEEEVLMTNERLCRERCIGVGLMFLVGTLAFLFLATATHPEGDAYGSGGEVPSDYAGISTARYNSTVLQLRADPPQLSSLLNESIEQSDASIISEVEWLLDFAIIGFPKCGTSSLKRWLNTSSSIFLDGYEVNGLSNNKPDDVVQHLYDVVSSQKPKVKVGIKNPTDLESSLQYYNRYFPNTQLFVLLRHPIHWFQSFYNFRRRKHDRLGIASTMPLLEHLIGKCHKKNDGVCTDRAQFHHAISRLGLTPMNTTEELALLDEPDVATLHPTSQKVFFLEVNQMKEDSGVLRRDLKRFLGVRDLPTMPTHNVTYESAEGEIDICHSNYTKVRKVLIEHGQRASQWIIDYLLTSDNAVVSSREEFIDHVKAWQSDPCIA